MKVLFVLAHTGAFRFYEGVIRELAADGHRSMVLFGALNRLDLAKQIRPMVECQRDVPEAQFGFAMSRRQIGLSTAVTRLSRELLSYGHYLGGRHPAPSVGARWTANLPMPLRPLARSWPGRKIMGMGLTHAMLRGIERMAPPSKRLKAWLRANEIDVVVASPFIMANAVEVDYVKAARALGIPTVVSALSWDHLTTKGTFHLMPDRLMVWNQAIAKEARDIHGVPDDRVAVTGAAVLDFWFDMEPDQDREAFCRRIGVDPARPYILYACSSTSITGDERESVRQFVEALRANPASNGVSVVLRPHPLNPGIWKDFSMENVIAWPEGGDIPDERSSRQDYLMEMGYAAAVVGVNTSAMVEAAAADRPCVTIVTDRYSETQEGRPHFHLLLDGDYMERADGMEAGAAAVGRILGGEDAKAEGRRAFAEAFIRPNGLDKRAAAMMAQTIESLAGGEPAPTGASG